MQKCLPFRWQKYWNCGTKEFDLVMILQDIDDLRLTVEERLLLTLLARIWAGERTSLFEIEQAARALDQEHLEVLADWIHAERMCKPSLSGAAACTHCTPKKFDEVAISAQKME